MTKKQEREQEILTLEALLEEEQRCLDYCISNPDECEDGEIEEREEYVGELTQQLDILQTI